MGQVATHGQAFEAYPDGVPSLVQCCNCCTEMRRHLSRISGYEAKFLASTLYGGATREESWIMERDEILPNAILVLVWKLKIEKRKRTLLLAAASTVRQDQLSFGSFFA